MGYSGRIVVARTEQRLAEVEALRGIAVLDEKTYGDGWQSVQLDGDLRTATHALVAQTQAPALSAYILDSDLADVSALTPGGVQWRAYLHEDAALELGALELDTARDEVVRRALAWSAEAGLQASQAGLLAALDAHDTFAEETFDELLAALGLTIGSSPLVSCPMASTTARCRSRRTGSRRRTAWLSPAAACRGHGRPGSRARRRRPCRAWSPATCRTSRTRWRA